MKLYFGEKKGIIKMKIFQKKIQENIIGKWEHYYIFGKKIHTKLICLYKYR